MPRQLCNLLIKLLINAQPDLLANVTRLGRRVTIDGQRHRFRYAGKGFTPEGDLLCGSLALAVNFAQPLALPEGVIGVLHRQRRPLRGLHGAARGIGAGEIAKQRCQRATIAGDMVDNQQQHMLPGLRKMEQAGAQRDLFCQLKRVGCGVIKGIGKRRSRDIAHLKRYFKRIGGEDLLPGLPLVERVARAQDLMTFNHIPHGFTQCGVVQLPL